MEPTGRAKKGGCGVSWLIIAVTACGVGIFTSLRACKQSDLAMCANRLHTTGRFILDWVAKNGALPWGKDIQGDEIVRRIDFKDLNFGLNCEAAAPGGTIGGWQMINASPETWDKILSEMEGKRIYILWCGKPHYKNLPLGRHHRVSFGLDLPPREDRRADASHDSSKQTTSTLSHLLSTRAAVFEVSDDELDSFLRLVNPILGKTTPIDLAHPKKLP